MPRRTCVGCRAVDEQDRLVRVVADRVGRIKMSRLRREPGRGAYLHPDRVCVERAVKRTALGKALRRNVVVVGVDELWMLVEQVMDRAGPAS